MHFDRSFSGRDVSHFPLMSPLSPTGLNQRLVQCLEKKGGEAHKTSLNMMSCVG